MKILTVVGARPQFIKMAQLSRALRADGIKENIIHTGQHYDSNMSQVFFEDLEIPEPSVNLGVATSLHGEATARMLIGIEAEAIGRKPDLLLLYGDTNSTLAGALAAAKLNVPIAHVEAGERCFDRRVPEEVNRVVTDHLSTFKFCVSDKAKANLTKEGIGDGSFTVGDLMYDAFVHFSPKAGWPESLPRKNGFVLATIHRAANTDDPSRLKDILEGLEGLEREIIFPVHPRTRKVLEANAIPVGRRISLVPPASYFEILVLLDACCFVATDSGGLQREAYYAKKKCLVLRDETEWTELVEAGTCKLTGTQASSISGSKEWALAPGKFESHLLGDGSAAKKILKALDGMG